MSEVEKAEQLYREHGWSGCAGSAWERLAPATREGWEHAAHLAPGSRTANGCATDSCGGGRSHIRPSASVSLRTMNP